MTDTSFDAVQRRLKEALGVSTDAAVAEALGMGATAYGNRKRAGSVPYQQIVQLAAQRNLDLSWLLIGPKSQAAEPATAYRGRGAETPEFEETLRRIKGATDCIVEAQRAAAVTLPSPWPNLLQELIVLYGMDPAGVDRVIEVWKREEGKR